jgi:hypothetical protein
MIRRFLQLFLLFAAGSASAMSIVVNCDQGQSLNRVLSMTNKDVPATVLVKGTCTEYVDVNRNAHRSRA